MIKIIVNGAKGRMGQTLIKLIGEEKNFELVGSVDVGDDLSDVIDKTDVVIDFSSALATENILKAVAAGEKTLVIATTGQTDEQKALIKEMSAKIPILMSPNMSVGVNLLWKLTEMAASVTGKDFDVSIIEKHHVHKKDAPSGTAKKMIEIVKNTVGNDYEVPCKAIREGEIVGEHYISFFNDRESIEIAHEAQTREIFADGALKAAAWIINKKPGLYSMQDVLFKG